MIRIKSRKVRKKGVTADFKSLLNNELYQVVDLREIYQNSAIENVFVVKRCLLAINEWVNQSLNEDPVSETGGFLLGRYVKKESEKYDVSLEVFVPSKQVDFQSPHRLEFGIQTLVDLEKIKEQIKEMTLIAWFHTHPNLTPFLSQKDIELHEHFFQQNYQMAIVLDSLSERWDSIFVSRDTNGILETKRDVAHWIAWKDFVV